MSMKSLIDIIKNYYIDLLTHGLVFIMGIGVGIGLNEVVNRILGKDND